MPGESTAGAEAAAGELGAAAGELGAGAAAGGDVAAGLAGALGDEDTLAPEGARTETLTEGVCG
jgi:hypothetical protein